ncbi:MAG: glycosyltransferase [Erysipelotrichaceae bacterium]|nr:glycosyltransferase [Erysipelotrichaceae bacterium]
MMNSSSPFLKNDSIDSLTHLSILFVLYNQKIDETEVYTYLKKSQLNFQWVIFDNSDENLVCDYNQKFIKPEKMLYLSYRKNLGLSKAYNFSIKKIRETSPDISWVLILDQDTQLNQDYLSEIIFLSETSEPIIYTPQVKSKKGHLSPSSFNPSLCFNLNTKQPKQFLSFPINSGTLWPINIFREHQFDESLFLDMIDFDIFFQLYSKDENIIVKPMASIINQSFSGDGFSTLSKDLNRFKIYTKDIMVFSKKWSVPSRYIQSLLIKRALKLNWHYKNFKFTQSLRTDSHKY